MWETNHHQVQHRITPCIIRNKSASNTTHSAQHSIIINTKHSAQQISIKYKAHHATYQYQIQSTARNKASWNTKHSAHQIIVHFDRVTARSIRDSIAAPTCTQHQHRFYTASKLVTTGSAEGTRITKAFTFYLRSAARNKSSPIHLAAFLHCLQHSPFAAFALQHSLWLFAAPMQHPLSTRNGAHSNHGLLTVGEYLGKKCWCYTAFTELL